MSTTSLRIYDGAVSIVTGAASGIGQALATELATQGSTVVLADLQSDLVERVAEDIRAKGGHAQSVTLDVTDSQAVEELLKQTMTRSGRLDFMFNNAGIRIVGPARLYSVEDWNRMIDVNLRGTVNGTHAAYQIMLQQGFGHIVNTASVAGLGPVPGETAYGMTKHGVVGLSKSLRSEAALDNIRVSVLCPGVINTPLLKGGTYGKTYADPIRLQKMFSLLRPMRAEKFAIKALDKIAKDEAIIVIPSWYKLLWWIGRLFPTLEIRLTQKYFEKLSQMLYSTESVESSHSIKKTP